MAAASSPYMATTKFSMFGWHPHQTSLKRNNLIFPVLSAQQDPPQLEQESPPQSRTDEKEKPKLGEGTRLRPVEPQLNVKSKNMSREYGGQWLSSTTRHVRIYAAYIDPVTCEFDQTQMDKLTILLDPSDEFLWTTETSNKVYGYFQDLVDHYEGAPLTEYTLRLIGSDVEHYIRKLLYDGEIQYNMNARVLNFSMGKPRIMFNNSPPSDPSSQQEATPSSSFTSTERLLSSAHHFISYVPAG